MKKILLVDDDTSLLAVLGDFLEGEGYDVLRAVSGEEALTKLRAGAKPALIILDMMMPGIGGVGVLEKLALPDGSFRFPLLVLTAKASMAEYFADKKVDGFLAKPCAPEDLAAEVNRIIFQADGAAQQVATSGKKSVFVADPFAARREAIAAALEDAGYAVMAFPDAPTLVQAAVTAPPAAVAASVALERIGAPELAELLKGMPATAAARILVYGIGGKGATLESIVALDPAQCIPVPGDTPTDILAALDAAMLG